MAKVVNRVSFGNNEPQSLKPIETLGSSRTFWVTVPHFFISKSSHSFPNKLIAHLALPLPLRIIPFSLYFPSRKSSVGYGRDEESPMDDEDLKEHWKKDDRQMSKTEMQDRQNK